MFGVLIFDILFFGVPAAMIVFFGISLFRYLAAASRNKTAPESFTLKQVKKRKTMLIVASVAAGVSVAVVLGFMALLWMAVAFM